MIYVITEFLILILITDDRINLTTYVTGNYCLKVLFSGNFENVKYSILKQLRQLHNSFPRRI